MLDLFALAFVVIITCIPFTVAAFIEERFMQPKRKPMAVRIK